MSAMTPEETALVELAGMKCPRCAGEGIIPASVADLDPAFTCPDCHGSGYLLDASVRVPCLDCDLRQGLDYCSRCAGRGWTAPCRREDFVTWCWALKAVGVYAVRIGLDPFAVSLFWLEEAWEDGMPGRCIDAEGVLTSLLRQPDV